MEKSQYGRQAAGRLLIRSKSGSRAAHSFTSKYSSGSTKIKKKQGEGGSGEGSLVRFLPRRPRSANSTSPSAWALSPGRSLPACSSPDEKPMTKGGGVMRYLRQKKAAVSPFLEEEYHQFRLLYSRLLQWRFANARAEASMAALNAVAQKKVLNGWVRISQMRKLTVEKRSEIQNQQQEMKLYQILGSELGLLNQWRRIEAKNVEAVGRVIRKLSAISLCLPLVHNAQVDVLSVYDAISIAVEVMDDTKVMILNMYWQVEKTCFLLTELSVMLRQYKQLFQEVETRVAQVASLEAEEKSLRVHHIQLVKEVLRFTTAIFVLF